MVLDADVDRDVFDSVRSVMSGTAPLDPDLADAFTARYGVPVLTSYGATEFGGGVAGWNLADHQQFAAAKRGSVGRAHAGCSLRIVDPDRGTDLGTDAVGLLEVRAAQLGTDEWVRTTDLARARRRRVPLDRGPRRPDHPPRRLQGAARGGARRARAGCGGAWRPRSSASPDDRLGAVPVAAIERRPGHEVDEEALLAEAGQAPRPVRGPGRRHRGRRAAAHRLGQGRSRRGAGDVRRRAAAVGP